MRIKNKIKHYGCPEVNLIIVDAQQIFSASGNSTSDFLDGGNLPGWEEGNITNGFVDGGFLPDFD